MHWQMIRTIFRKDLIEAIRDARVLVAILVPLGIGVFYNFAFDDEIPKPTVHVVYTVAGQTTFIEHLTAAVENSVDLTTTQVDSADEVEQRITSGDDDVGFVVPDGFDQALEDGKQPPLRILILNDADMGGQFVVGSIEPVLRQMADQQSPAAIDLTVIAPQPGEEDFFTRVGIRTWSVMLAGVMTIAMITVLAVPIILAEEVERKTIDALVLIASYADVIAAKALVGLVYIAIMIPVLLGMTSLTPKQPVLFAAGVAVLAIALLGFGLLLGGLFRSANQLNTWSGLLLVPLIAPTAMVGLPIPHILQTIAGLIPTGAAMKILLNGMTGEAIFQNLWLSFLVMIVWGIAAYCLLLWDLNRRRG